MNLWRGNGQGIPSRGVPRQDGKEGHPGVDVYLTSCSGGMDMSLPFVERKGWGERHGGVFPRRERSTGGLFHWGEKHGGVLSRRESQVEDFFRR